MLRWFNAGEDERLYNGGTSEVDVVVVGGGPSGLYTARVLAQSGYGVALYEQSSEIGKDVVCSGVISAEAFERFDLPDDSVVGTLREAELLSPSGLTLLYDHPRPAAYVVDRHAFDGALGEFASSAGARIVLGTRVTGIEVCGDRVEVRTTSTSGKGRVSAKVVVIATGVNYRLQSQLGLGRPSRILKGVQLEADFQTHDRLRLYFGNRFSKGFFGWAIPLENGRTRIGVMTEGDAVRGFENIFSELAGGKISPRCACGVKRRGIAFGAIGKTFSKGVLVVGEAAGQIKTTTGGGIYWGIIAAHHAAETIKLAFSAGDFSEKTLSEYEKRWRGELGSEISLGKHFHRFFSRLDDEGIDKLFDAAMEDGLLSFIAERGRFDWHLDAVIKILRSPNLRRVLLAGYLNGALSFG